MTLFHENIPQKQMEKIKKIKINKKEVALGVH